MLFVLFTAYINHFPLAGVHCTGSLMNIASDLLLYGAEKESTRLDEHLLLDFDGPKLKQRSKLPRPNLRG
jgi:hypothetical protein